MTAIARVQMRKEFRELLPSWLAVVGAMLGLAAGNAWLAGTDQIFRVRLLWPTQFQTAGMLMYAAGAVLLGAMAIGREYSHHTLPTLLSQPTTRTRLLLMKAVVLTTLLASLAGVAGLAFGLDMIQGGPRNMVLGWVPLACGLCLAPLLAMVGRGTLAGAVLSAALTVALFPTGAYFGVPYTAVQPIILVLAAAGAVATWWMFRRLEVAGGPQSEIDLLGQFTRAPRRTASGRKYHPLSLLVRKELRIQQPTFAVAILFLLAWLAVTAGNRWLPGVVPETTLYVAMYLLVGLVPLMAGALASAEERRFDTADWHLLLPVAAWTQWTVKAGVAVVCAVVLTVALPLLLNSLAFDAGLQSAGIPPPVGMALFCLAALYVSSLSTNGVHALLATPPLIGAAVVLLMVVTWPLVDSMAPAGRWLADVLPPVFRVSPGQYRWWLSDGTWWLVAGLGLLLFHFGFVNHATAERSRRTVIWQFGWATAYALGALLVLSVVSALFAASIRQGG